VGSTRFGKLDLDGRWTVGGIAIENSNVHHAMVLANIRIRTRIRGLLSGLLDSSTTTSHSGRLAALAVALGEDDWMPVTNCATTRAAIVLPQNCLHNIRFQQLLRYGLSIFATVAGMLRCIGTKANRCRVSNESELEIMTECSGEWPRQGVQSLAGRRGKLRFIAI
jgi:hypothetical protein